MKDKQVIGPGDVGSLEDVLGPNDPLFQPEPDKEWICPRCGHRNPHKNEDCGGAEMGDGRCGYRPAEEHETDSDGNLLGLG